MRFGYAPGMWRSHLARALVVPLLVAWAGTAEAHLELLSPVSRYGRTVLKAGPCGKAGGQRTANVTRLPPGATIDVTWNEYVNHPGHFRISFDDDGDDSFVDPVCVSGCDTRTPVFEFDTDPTILLDDIPDTNGGESTVRVTLPDIECDTCTLQVIQVMVDKPPYTLPGNDIYYQCADLVLSADAPADGGAPPGEGDGGPGDAGSGSRRDEGGCACTAAGGGSSRGSGAPGALALLALTAIVRLAAGPRPRSWLRRASRTRKRGTGGPRPSAPP